MPQSPAFIHHTSRTSATTYLDPGKINRRFVRTYSVSFRLKIHSFSADPNAKDLLLLHRVFFSLLYTRQAGVGINETTHLSVPQLHRFSCNGGNHTLLSHDDDGVLLQLQELPLMLFGACSFAASSKNRCC